MHICTRDTCEFIVNMKDEHKQVCVLTGTEYLRDYEMVFGYDAADDEAVDQDSAYTMNYVNFEQEDEEAVNNFKKRLEFKRRKRASTIERYEKVNNPQASDIQQVKPEKEEVSSDEHSSAPYRRKKQKNMHEMTHYEKKHELSNDRCFVEQSIKKFPINMAHFELVMTYVMDTWLIVNMKEFHELKSKSAFYTLFMHISVVFKYIQDGLNGLVQRIDNLLVGPNGTNNLSATEICSTLSVNTKYYTTCCTIFRQIMKHAVDKGYIKKTTA